MNLDIKFILFDILDYSIVLKPATSIEKAINSTDPKLFCDTRFNCTHILNILVDIST